MYFPASQRRTSQRFLIQGVVLRASAVRDFERLYRQTVRAFRSGPRNGFGKAGEPFISSVNRVMVGHVSVAADRPQGPPRG